MAAKSWPYTSLTQAPTNLKEAIDWVLRVTGKDGKKNEAAAVPQPPPASTNNGPQCLCYLAKAVKDLLYDAKDPGTPGPSPERYWNELLLKEEQSIVKPVLEDLGLLSAGSTSAASTTYTCAGGTEVIKALIDQLALGLQKWVGWQDKGDDCCLKGTEGIGRECKCTGTSGQCCTGGGSAGTTCHECTTCGKDAGQKCYLSAYCKKNGAASSSTNDQFLWTSISSDSTKVHLLARIFLGSVCLIWSGLSQLGFLTGGSGNNETRWSQDGKLHEEQHGLGSFMAAMGYDLDRLNQGSGPGTGKKGSQVAGMLTESIKDLKEGANSNSVAEYYSSIYGAAQSAAKGSSKNTESICKEYPLLVLHILASGYFRAGSAGANKVTAKAAPTTPKTTTDEASKKPRHPRTIREILYWLSALPYSQGYKTLVDRMQHKYPPKEGNPKELARDIKLYDEKASSGAASTTLLRDNITHYLLAACGYCPLVLIGIQGTIATSGTDSDTAATGSGGGGSGSSTDKKHCPNHKDNRHKRCDPKNIKEEQVTQAQAGNGKPLEKGEVCYDGYHLAVKDFGPLHGMYANGLFGFDLGGSAAQCLDQLRVYVYHCFYQLYFLRKQCTVGVVDGAAGVGASGKTVLGWKSCRYGFQVAMRKGGDKRWMCSGMEGSGSAGSAVGGDQHAKQCGVFDGAQSKSESPLQSFLCDGLNGMCCGLTTGKGNIDEYPPIEDHMKCPQGILGHFGGPPKHCPVPMGWKKENHFKDLKDTHKQEDLYPKGGKGTPGKYPAHCTGRTLSYLLEYYCDPEECQSGTLVVLLRLLACITPTVPRTLGDLFGFYYYIVYINTAGLSWEFTPTGVRKSLMDIEKVVSLHMGKSSGTDGVIGALTSWGNKDGDSSTSGSCKGDTLKCLTECSTGTGAKYLSPLSGQQYGQLSPVMAGTYLSWLVYLIGEFKDGLDKLKEEFKKVDCKSDGCKGLGGVGCGDSGQCTRGTHGDPCKTDGSGVCGCTSVVSCTGVLPVLYKYGFGYGNVTELHNTTGGGAALQNKQCHHFLDTLKSVLHGNHLKKDGTSGGLHHEINQLIYTTRLPWIFVLAVAWLVAVLYLAFGAIWPLDWTHMRSHCRGWFRKGSLSPWEVLMVGKKKGRGILEFFGRR